MKRPANLLLQSGTVLADVLDNDAFKREIVRSPGLLTDPPESKPVGTEEIPGLVYKPHFISNEEEQDLVEHIDAREWSTVLSRRVQQYGWQYDYRQRHIDPTMYLGALPCWTNRLVQRLVDEGYLRERPDQLIVNEYKGKQGISPHVDKPDDFAEQVVTISLLETWSMVFRSRDGKHRVEKPLEHGSIAVFTGDVRYQWTHAIPKRKYERVGIDRKRIPRQRRISLTFGKTELPETDLLNQA